MLLFPDLLIWLNLYDDQIACQCWCRQSANTWHTKLKSGASNLHGAGASNLQDNNVAVPAEFTQRPDPHRVPAVVGKILVLISAPVMMLPQLFQYVNCLREQGDFPDGIDRLDVLHHSVYHGTAALSILVPPVCLGLSLADSDHPALQIHVLPGQGCQFSNTILLVSF